MATMTPEQIQAELARKKSLGKLPTDPNNTAAYNALPKPTGPQNSSPGTTGTGTTTLNAPAGTINSALPQQPKDPFSAYGGRSNYITNQNNRWNAAQSIKDFGTISKLEADAKRVGYGFTSAADQQNAADFQTFKTKQNDWLTKMEELQNTPFSYDPNTDPKYQAMQALAKQRAGVASQSAMEALNDRGILNSSVTASQLGQIQQNAEQEALSYIPQYEALARQDYRDRVADALNMYTTYKGADDTAYNRQQDSKKFAIDEAGVTGLYNGQKTAAQSNSDRTYALEKANSDLNKTQIYAQLTGTMPDGTKTTAQQQIELANLWKAADESGKIPNELADLYKIPRGTPTQAAYQYAQSLQLSRDQMSQNNDQFWAGQNQNSEQFWANYNQNADQFNRTLDSKNAADAPKDTYTPTQIGDIISQNFKDSFDNKWKSDADKQNAASFIIDSVSDANQALQIARANGLTEDEFMAVLQQKAKENQSGN